ncbi:MAG: acyltransferase [Candidatus Velthaea sp.]|jgi:peptidoglycan/LPS O-acetylase OafA/YrhL
MGKRFAFANQLRGVASLCVVVNHLAGVYWTEPQLVAASICSAAVSGAAPPFTVLAAGRGYNLGPFGVALFFLISGFVIPISLERQTRAGFLLARAFRIYPAYMVALAIELGVVALSAALWHQPAIVHPRLILANLLLITDIVNVPSIDLVNWTLTIELKFYLLIAALAPLIRRGSLLTLFAVAAVILFVSAYSRAIFLLAPFLGNALRIFESNALYLLYMLIGVVFSYHARRLIGDARAAASVIALFAAFVVCWPLTFFRAGFPDVTLNYAWALLVFGGMYLLRRSVRDLRAAGFFASISYPLYLVHALVGFSVMSALIGARQNAIFATLAGFTAAVALALVLHHAVELPSQAYGKSLATRIFGTRDSSPTQA